MAIVMTTVRRRARGFELGDEFVISSGRRFRNLNEDGEPPVARQGTEQAIRRDLDAEILRGESWSRAVRACRHSY